MTMDPFAILALASPLVFIGLGLFAVILHKRDWERMKRRIEAANAKPSLPPEVGG